MRRVTLVLCRFKGGPGDKIMRESPRFSRPTDPYRQDPQPPHRVSPRPPANKTGADKEFMQYQIKQFELGKRHLGNMMGVDSELMTQKDINHAIRYLFPTGIFSKLSRPVMKDPREMFTVSAQLDVDETKRPRNPFFYTPNAQFSNLCFVISDAIEKCDNDLRDGKRSERLLPYDPKSQNWLSADKLGSIIKSSVSDENMIHFNSLVRRLACHPMAAKYEALLDVFRVKTDSSVSSSFDGNEGRNMAPTINNVDGFLQSNPYDRVAVAKGSKFTARAKVEVRPCKEDEEPQVTINGRLLSEHFDFIQDREQVMFPISVTKMYEKFHINATVEGGGRSSQSNSVRLALSRAMVPFLEENLVEKLRLSGLLTRDPRRRERQKIGQRGPRRKKQFRKR